MDNILLSVKKNLGLDDEIKDFDVDIKMNINSAISTLRQIGVGPIRGFTVLTGEETYDDFLGSDSLEKDLVARYLVCKTRLGFDPPTNSTLVQTLKDEISELEWRIRFQVDPPETLQ